MVRKRSVVRNSHKKMGVSFLSPYAFGHALGLVSVIALLFYAVMVWFGNFSGSIIIVKYPLAFSFTKWTIVIGLIQSYVMSYIGGWIFAKIYNKTISE